MCSHLSMYIIFAFFKKKFACKKRYPNPKYLSVGEWIKQMIVYSNNGILFNNKKESTTDTRMNLKSLIYTSHCQVNFNSEGKQNCKQACALGGGVL